MNKSQRRTRKAVTAILVATKLTQRDFAEMIGASLDTVKGWMRKKNPSPISLHFESRILAATGAKIRGDGSVISEWGGGPALVERRKNENGSITLIRYGESQPAGASFTFGTYIFWRTYVAKSNQSLAAFHSFLAADLVRHIFHAASMPVRGHRNKLPAVWTSFVKWKDDTIKDFNLSRQMDYFQEDPTLMSPMFHAAFPAESTSDSSPG